MLRDSGGAPPRQYCSGSAGRPGGGRLVGITTPRLASRAICKVFAERRRNPCRSATHKTLQLMPIAERDSMRDS
jgi:hypothetical protein